MGTVMALTARYRAKKFGQFYHNMKKTLETHKSLKFFPSNGYTLQNPRQNSRIFCKKLEKVEF
jgi:hypothetical protein